MQSVTSTVTPTSKPEEIGRALIQQLDQLRPLQQSALVNCISVLRPEDSQSHTQEQDQVSQVDPTDLNSAIDHMTLEQQFRLSGFLYAMNPTSANKDPFQVSRESGPDHVIDGFPSFYQALSQDPASREYQSLYRHLTEHIQWGHDPFRMVSIQLRDSTSNTPDELQTWKLAPKFQNKSRIQWALQSQEDIPRTIRSLSIQFRDGLKAHVKKAQSQKARMFTDEATGAPGSR